jgi:subtilase family serine protease
MKVHYAILAVLPVVVAAARPPLPDLRPMVVVGSNTQITIRIANRGTAPAPAGLVRVVLGAPINTAHNYAEPALAVGEIKSVIIPVGKPLAGVHYAVRVDGTGAISESNETNNVATGNF